MNVISVEHALHVIKAIVILDSEGNRLFSKYYDKNVLSTGKEQKAFERRLYTLTQPADEGIVVINDLTCVYRSSIDLFLCIVGGCQENELMLADVLRCLYDSLKYILKPNIEKRIFLENWASVMLTIDEICDKGVILEFDGASVIKKIDHTVGDIIGEQTFAAVYRDITGMDYYE